MKFLLCFFFRGQAVGAVATYVIIMMQFNKDPDAEEKMSNMSFPLKGTIIQNVTSL